MPEVPTLPRYGGARQANRTIGSTCSPERSFRDVKWNWVQQYARDANMHTFRHFVRLLISRQAIDHFHKETERVFRQLATEWNREAGKISNPVKLFMHKKYQQIIGLGPQAVPFMMQDIADGKGNWYWAIAAITREDPIRPEDAGDMAKIRMAWIAWGKERGYLDASEGKSGRFGEQGTYRGRIPEHCGKL